MFVERRHSTNEVDHDHLHIEPLKTERTVDPQPISKIEVKRPEQHTQTYIPCHVRNATFLRKKRENTKIVDQNMAL